MLFTAYKICRGNEGKQDYSGESESRGRARNELSFGCSHMGHSCIHNEVKNKNTLYFLKSLYWICYFFFFFSFCLFFWPQGLWDANSLTRDRTHNHCIGRWSQCTGMPGKSSQTNLELIWRPSQSWPSSQLFLKVITIQLCIHLSLRHFLLCLHTYITHTYSQKSYCGEAFLKHK